MPKEEVEERLLEEVKINDKEEGKNNTNAKNNKTTTSSKQQEKVTQTAYQEEEDDEEEDLDEQADTVMTILKPVSITMLFVIWAVKAIEEETSSTTRFQFSTLSLFG